MKYTAKLLFTLFLIQEILHPINCAKHLKLFYQDNNNCIRADASGSAYNTRNRPNSRSSAKLIPKWKPNWSPKLSSSKWTPIRRPRSIKNKIAFGEYAEPGEFPYIVSLRLPGEKYEHYCGGVIIHTRWVLTSKNCISAMIGDINSDKKLLLPWAMINTDNRLTTANKLLIRGTVLCFLDAHEMALLQLEKGVVFDDKYFPIKLPKKNVSPGSSLVAAGWGYIDYEKYSDDGLVRKQVNVFFGQRQGIGKLARVPLHSNRQTFPGKTVSPGSKVSPDDKKEKNTTNQSTTFAATLMKGAFQVVKQEKCQKVQDLTLSQKNSICTISAQHPCFGDSGSPLIVKNSNSREDVLAGIIHFVEVKHCARDPLFRLQPNAYYAINSIRKTLLQFQDDIFSD